MALQLKDWEEMNHAPVNDDRLLRSAMEPLVLAQSTAPGPRAIEQRVKYTAHLARTGAPQHFSHSGSGIVSAATLSLAKVGGVGIEFQPNPDGWPVITSLAPYGRAALSGLVDVGDVLFSVNDEPVKGLPIKSVVEKVVGPPGSRVKLELLRTKDKAELPGLPVMVEPFNKYKVQLARTALPGDQPNGAGLGIIIQKVPYPGFGEYTDASGNKFQRSPVMVQALNSNGSAYKSGLVQPGDLILSINDQDIGAMAMPEILNLVKGQPNTMVDLVIERGVRHPYIFSHEVKPAPGMAYVAPRDAYWVEVVSTDQPLGLHLDNYQAPGQPSAAGTDVTPLSIRGSNNISFESRALAPKTISRVDPNTPTANSLAFRSRLLQEGLLLHAIDGMSVHGDKVSTAEAESWLKHSVVGRPVKLLVSKRPPPPPAAAAPAEPVQVQVPVEKTVEVPVEKVVEKVVYVEKPVEVPVEKIVEKAVPSAAAPPKEVQVPVERIVEHPIEKIVTVEKIVEKLVEVPVERPAPAPAAEKVVEKIVEVPVERVVYQMLQPTTYLQEPVYQQEPVQYMMMAPPPETTYMLPPPETSYMLPQDGGYIIPNGYASIQVDNLGQQSIQYEKGIYPPVSSFGPTSITSIQGGDFMYPGLSLASNPSPYPAGYGYPGGYVQQI